MPAYPPIPPLSRACVASSSDALPCCLAALLPCCRHRRSRPNAMPVLPFPLLHRCILRTWVWAGPHTGGDRWPRCCCIFGQFSLPERVDGRGGVRPSVVLERAGGGKAARGVWKDARGLSRGVGRGWLGLAGVKQSAAGDAGLYLCARGGLAALEDSAGCNAAVRCVACVSCTRLERTRRSNSAACTRATHPPSKQSTEANGRGRGGAGGGVTVHTQTWCTCSPCAGTRKGADVFMMR